MSCRLFYLMIIGVLLFTVDGLGQNTWGYLTTELLKLNQNTWVKTYGGFLADNGFSVTSTNDNGLFIVGRTTSDDGDFNCNGCEDIFIMKLNTNGEIIWSNTIGDSNCQGGLSITKINDKYYILGWEVGGDFDIMVMNIDDNGKNEWMNTYGGSRTEGLPLRSFEDGNYIISTNDGGLLLTGFTKSNDGDFEGMNKGQDDIFVIKLNTTGSIVWVKTYGGSSDDIGRSITKTKNSEYLVTGFTTSNDGDFEGMNKGKGDIFLIKIDSSGDLLWRKTYGGSEYDWGNSITTTNDGGYVLTGLTNSNDGDFSGMNKGSSDIFVMKLNSSGDIVWKKTFGGISHETGRSITTTHDGGYIITGETNSNDGDFFGMNKGQTDIFVIKLKSNGEFDWLKTYGGSSQERSNSIISMIDGGYVITGSTTSCNGDFNTKRSYEHYCYETDVNWDVFVMKLDSKGNIHN